MLSIHLYELLLFVVCFLLGSIPWGVVISRIFYKRDIRESGSGNIGSTNALRTLGKRGGAAVFVRDFGKGLVAGLLALWASPALQTALFDGVPGALAVGYSMYLSGEEAASEGAAVIHRTCVIAAFMAATLGHIFSPWLKFKGGKGVAVAIGALFVAFGPVGALIEIVIFAVVVAVSRYVSAGSVAAAVACPFIALYLYWGHPLAIAAFLVTALVVIWAHRGNIKRLANGTESKLGQKKPAPQQ